MVSASSSRAPRASRNPAPPRFTHVTGKNGASIPVAKASKQELTTGLEQYFRRHGEYPDSYPGGPQDLSDSGDEDSGDEPGDGHDSETPTHTTGKPLTHTSPQIPDSQPPSKRRRYNSSGPPTPTPIRSLPPAHPTPGPHQLHQVSQQLLDEEFQRERERKEELHQLEVQERRARLQREAAADERAATAVAQPSLRTTAANDENGETTLTGEERSFINNILAAHISVPEKYIIQIFQSSFNPLNLPKLHRNGIDLAEKPDEVQLSSTGQMSIKKARGSVKDFGQSPAIWLDGFMVYSDIVHQLFGQKFPALPSALLRFCRQIIDLSKIYVWNDAVLLLALRYHQHVMRSGQTSHEQWSPIPDNVVYQFCRPDKVRASTTTAPTSSSRRDSSRSTKDPNDNTVICLNFRKYGECRSTWCKRRHEKPTQPGAGGPQASKQDR
jgi:hypothetical protein